MSKGYVGGAYDDYGGDYGRGHDRKNGFALLVVLFILLIIVGAAFMKDCY